MSILDIVLLLCFLLGIVFTLVNIKIKHKNINNYFIYGRKLTGLNLAFLWGVAWVGGASTLGLIENTYYYGVSAYWYIIAIFVGTILFAFLLAPKIRTVGDKLNQVTFSDIIEDRYDYRCRNLVTLINIITFILYIASQIVAISYILGLIGIPYHIAVVVGTLLFSVYTARGGMAYISKIAYLYSIFIIFGALIIIIYSSSQLLEIFSAPVKDAFLGFSDWGLENIIIVFVAILCSILTSSDGYMRCLAAKDERATKVGLTFSAVLIILMTVGFLLIGLYSKLNFSGMLTTAEIINLLWNDFAIGIKGIFIITLLSVILSTADISLMVATANISKDIYNRIIHTRADQEVLLKVTYLSSIIVTVIAAIIALVINNIFVIVMWAFKITTISLTVPVLGAYFWSRGQAKGAFYSMIVSLIITAVWAFFQLKNITGIDELWVGLLSSICVYFIHGLSVKQSEEDFRKSQAYCKVNIVDNVNENKLS